MEAAKNVFLSRALSQGLYFHFSGCTDLGQFEELAQEAYSQAQVDLGPEASGMPCFFFQQ